MSFLLIRLMVPIFCGHFPEDQPICAASMKALALIILCPSVLNITFMCMYCMEQKKSAEEWNVTKLHKINQQWIIHTFTHLHSSMTRINLENKFGRKPPYACANREGQSRNPIDDDDDDDDDNKDSWEKSK